MSKQWHDLCEKNFMVFKIYRDTVGRFEIAEHHIPEISVWGLTDPRYYFNNFAIMFQTRILSLLSIY